MKKSNIIMTLILIIIILFPNLSFAGGGGGGGGKKQPKNEPKYYSFEDLRAGLKEQTFYFANSNIPPNALVNLGYNIWYPASADKRTMVRSMVSVSPVTYGVNSAKVQSRWDDSFLIDFEWDNYYSRGGDNGDLIFTRANGKGPDLVKVFSNWTHVAVCYNYFGKKVFEALPDTGVKINYAPSSWGKVTYYTCKRIETIPYSQRLYVMELATTRFKDKPYFPQISTFNDRLAFVAKWSDKNDMGSMYCSKLVWHTFKDFVNFDTNNTSLRLTAWNGDLIDKAPGAPMFAWTGISPDDIYYSGVLGGDFCYSENCKSL